MPNYSPEEALNKALDLAFATGLPFKGRKGLRAKANEGRRLRLSAILSSNVKAKLIVRLSADQSKLKVRVVWPRIDTRETDGLDSAAKLHTELAALAKDIEKIPEILNKRPKGMQTRVTMRKDGTLLTEVISRSDHLCSEIYKVTNAIGRQVSDEEIGPECDSDLDS